MLLICNVLWFVLYADIFKNEFVLRLHSSSIIIILIVDFNFKRFQINGFVINIKIYILFLRKNNDLMQFNGF
jgi:hypothetical protein